MRSIYLSISQLIMLYISLLFLYGCTSTFELASMPQPIVVSDIVGINKTKLPTNSPTLGSINGFILLDINGFIDRYKLDANRDFNEHLLSRPFKNCVTDLTFKVKSHMNFLGMGAMNIIQYSANKRRIN